MEINAIKNILKQKFGEVFNEEMIFSEDYIEEYNYLIEKYQLTTYEKNILYYILNINYPIKKNEDFFHLLISMYNEEKISRSIELLLSLSKNLQNKNIGEVHILYEASENSDNILFISEVIYIIQYTLKLPVKTTYTYNRPSYKYLFKYTNENIVGNTIISNTDIIYNDSLCNVSNIEDDLFLCISRHNKIIENNIVKWEPIILDLPSHLPQNLQNSFSQDTWIFKSPMKYNLYIETLLGKMFCDSYLNFKLSNTSYKCYNLANDIKCYHIQEDNSFSQTVSKNNKLLEEYMEELVYRESGNIEIIFALPIQNIEHFYNKTNFSLFCSHSDFVKENIPIEEEAEEAEEPEEPEEPEE